MPDTPGTRKGSRKTRLTLTPVAAPRLDPVTQASAWYRDRARHITISVNADGPNGWHLSISGRDRYPSWDEIVDARYRLVPDEVTMALLLPPREEWVNAHEFCFHLHQVAGETPLDPVAELDRQMQSVDNVLRAARRHGFTP